MSAICLAMQSQVAERQIAYTACSLIQNVDKSK